VPAFGAPYAPSETDLPTLIGRYRVMRPLATGSTSDILLAREEGPHGFARVVVLKVLLPRFRDDEGYGRLFAREASAYARLPHPAVARLYQLLSDEGELALVLEYVEGLALNKLRAELHRVGDRLGDQASMFIAFRLFSALSAAHSARDPLSGEFSPVIHGDVNPSNMIVPWDGYAKLIDFGSATLSGIGGVAQATLFPHPYWAPEQARGHEVSPRSDLYSASLILWELLTGRRAMTRGRESNDELRRALADRSLPSLAALRPDLPRSIHDIVARGLRIDPDRRDVFAEDACAVLRAAVDLGRARTALAEGLAGMRFASIEDTHLATTPNLSRYGPLAKPSPPPPPVQYPSDRPVVLAGPPIIATGRSPWGAGVFAWRRSPRVFAWRRSPAFALLALAVGCAGLLLRRGPAKGPADTAPSPIATFPRPALAAASREPAASEIPSAPSAAAPAAASSAVDPAPTRATITVPASRAGHRVWVDGRLVGQSPATFVVRCGAHAVRVGSHGFVQQIEVRCGTDVVVR
jgi:serine/threonine protein kinase